MFSFLAASLLACNAPSVADGRSLGVTYEIYVRSFQDSDGDGIGDLEGVRERLDHVASLGVETIWLMPVFPAAGPAGYDVTDYDAIRAEYGSEADLARLVEDAHALGMRVLIDLPLNHVSRTHPWFTEAEADPDDAERARFVFRNSRPDDVRWFPATGGGYYYGYFGADLPDLDWTDRGTHDRMLDVFDGWLDEVDGYRLDAVLQLVEDDESITGTEETHALLAELHDRARAANPGAVLLAEASDGDVEGGARYLGTPDAPESDRFIDFPRRDALLGAIADGEPASLIEHLTEQEDAGSLGRTSPYLQSHDLSRLPTDVPDADARRLLRVLLLTLPGDPILYYGEELDLADATTATGQDYAWRAPMAWDSSKNGGFTTADVAWMTPDPGFLAGKDVADAEADPTSTLNLLRGLGCVRREVGDASFEVLDTNVPSVLAFERDTGAGRIVVVANLADHAVDGVSVRAAGAMRDLASGAEGDGTIGRLPAYGYRVYADGVANACVIP